MDDNLKQLWIEENHRLNERLKMNEPILRASIKQSVNEFEEMLKVSILGRNLALVYAVISIVYGVRNFYAWEYSVPAFAGAITMIWSFTMHLSLKRIAFDKLPVIDLQKQICQFRIHTASHSQYDMGIVAFWLITIIPSVLMNHHNLMVFDTLKSATLYLGISAAFGLVTYPLIRKIYVRYDTKLKVSEDLLLKIILFEKS